MKRKIIYISLFIFCIVVLSVVLIFAPRRFKHYYLYQDYYNMTHNVCDNPGFDDGFVPQGIAVCDDEDLIITSGYMKEDNQSRLYIIKEKENISYLDVYYNDKPLNIHFGGVAICEEMVYISSTRNIFMLSKEELLNAVDKININKKIAVNNRASFVECDENYLYVGEFYYQERYITNHTLNYENRVYHAICSAYALDDLTQPAFVYAIPDSVQGFCVTDDGYVVISTSYGTKNAKISVYNQSGIVLGADSFEGVPVYYLINPVYSFDAPAYNEDLGYYDGKVYSLTEKFVKAKYDDALYWQLYTDQIYSFEVKE